jgi:hypothetical protein
MHAGLAPSDLASDIADPLGFSYFDAVSIPRAASVISQRIYSAGE